MNGQLNIGQVAKEIGIPAKTIRYYEEIKLLQPAERMDNGYRKYSKEDIARLRLIKQARALGLPIKEVKQLVKECLDGSCEHLRIRMLTHLPNYIASVNERITELGELKRQLEKLENNLNTIQLSRPQKRVADKDCCEVLEQMEKITKKGGFKNEEGFRT